MSAMSTTGVLIVRGRRGSGPRGRRAKALKRDAADHNPRARLARPHDRRRPVAAVVDPVAPAPGPVRQAATSAVADARALAIASTLVPRGTPGSRLAWRSARLELMDAFGWSYDEAAAFLRDYERADRTAA